MIANYESIGLDLSVDAFLGLLVICIKNPVLNIGLILMGLACYHEMGVFISFPYEARGMAHSDFAYVCLAYFMAILVGAFIDFVIRVIWRRKRGLR
jgi:hypothetical protein